MYITTNQPDAEYNHNANHTAKQHAVVSIQLNSLISHTYPEKLKRDNDFVRFSLLSFVTDTLPQRCTLGKKIKIILKSEL